MPHFFTLEARINHQTLLNLTRLFANEEGTCLLYSGGSFETAERSFLGLFPYDFIRIQDNKQICSHSNEESRLIPSMENPWEALKSIFSFGHSNDFPEWIGFFGYEMGASSDLQRKLKISSNGLDAYFQRSAVTLIVNHQTESGVVWISDQAEYFLNDEQKHWFERLSLPGKWQDLLQVVSKSDENEEIIPSVALAAPLETEDAYIKKIEQAKEWIQAGDIYQVNLSQQISLQGYVDPYQLFYRLSRLNPAPFSAYLKLKDFTIVSTSPERFLQKKKDWIETRPIKGTAPRGRTQEEDRQNRMDLLTSSKERAELLMITDLMRNDLGRVSLPGSVMTSQIWECEAYTNVFHLFSTIHSQLLPGLHPIDVIRACFPGGSITGCPKLSAMDVIRVLEKRCRGIYTGAIGYLSSQGNFDLNIAIRTMVISNDLINIQLGGAIVADSDPYREYEETLHKGSSLFKCLNFNFPSSGKS